jgi:molybdopterin-guanine dinucleotide biosynthesis protein A
VAPCDTPFLPRDLCPRLYAALQHHQADIAITHDGQRLQPLCVLLRRNLLGSLNAELASGHLKVQRWMVEQHHCVVDFSDHAAAFININSAAELTAVETKPATDDRERSS